MRIPVLLSITVLYTFGAFAAEKQYDDRQIIKNTVPVARSLRSLLPPPKSAAKQTAKFRSPEVLAVIKEIRSAQFAIRAALRRPEKSKTIADHRRKMLSLAAKVPGLVEAYGTAAKMLSSADKRLSTVKASDPKC